MPISPRVYDPPRSGSLPTPASEKRATTPVIKYLGSKRLLVSRILDLAERLRPGGTPGTLADLFSGTSRVGHAFKRAGWRVLANDHNAYAHALGLCYVQADREEVLADAERLIGELARLPGRAGYFTQMFCVDARYVHPRNGERIDAIRDQISRWSLPPELEAVLLVSLMEAADRVDSTTGLQMAYLKDWAPRASNNLELRVPDVLSRATAGKGRATCLDAAEAAADFDADIAYLDPPYNQHSYLGNYHVWETLVRWDEPAAYGIARKREDCRQRRSAFNSRATIGDALRRVLHATPARVLIVSFSDEGYLPRASIESMLRERGGVVTVPLEYKRYVGAQIGIYNPKGEKVGRPGKLRNVEHLFISHREMSEGSLKHHLGLHTPPRMDCVQAHAEGVEG